MVEVVVDVESPLPPQDEATRAMAATTAKRRRDVWVSMVLAILRSTNTDEMQAAPGDKLSLPRVTRTPTSPVCKDETDRREHVMDWWVLELIVTSVLVLILFVLGPVIKRFGKSYAADIFRSNPRTGKSYLVLMDVAYYLIFTAFILFTISFERERALSQEVVADQLESAAVRVGGMLLLMGILHGHNVISLPIIGRLLGLGRTLEEDTPEPKAA